MKYIHFKEIDSTNAYLKKHYKDLNNWTIVTADKQIRGYGRLNHLWTSKRNENLLVSILIKDRKIIKYNDSLVLLVGVSIFKLLKSLKIKNIKIKRPNDIYVNNKKICGILLEMVSLGDNIESLIIGIGLNINQTKFNKRLNAISIKNITNKNYEIKEILDKLLIVLKSELKNLKPDYNRYLLEKYKKYIVNKIN